MPSESTSTRSPSATRGHSNHWNPFGFAETSTAVEVPETPDARKILAENAPHRLLNALCALVQARGESMVFAELHKLVRNADLPWRIHHLRTTDGREVDFLLEHETGFVAIECKNALRTSQTDFRHLRNLEELLPKPILLKLLVSMDPGPCRHNFSPRTRHRPSRPTAFLPLHRAFRPMNPLATLLSQHIRPQAHTLSLLCPALGALIA